MANLVRYPFPLGRGEFCFLYLPNPLTADVAARIIATIQTLVLEPSEAPASVDAVDPSATDPGTLTTRDEQEERGRDE